MFKHLGKDPNFNSNLALFGDAKVVNGDSRVQLTKSVSGSAGRVVYKKPIKFVEGSSTKKFSSFSSFSTSFSFSITRGYGEGLGFFMVPRSRRIDNVFDFDGNGNSSFGISLRKGKSNASVVVVVEFDTLKDSKYGDLNGNHVGIDVGSLESVKVRSLSSINLELSNGGKLFSWIDYEATSKRFEIRLSRDGGNVKPVSPLLSYSLDLSKMWGEEEVFVGLSSSNGNSSQTCSIYSWSFKLRHVPRRMHSLPLDPKVFNKKSESLAGNNHTKSDCLVRVLGALVVGTACGALAASCVLYLWTIFGNRRPVAPEECGVRPVDLEYKKKFNAVEDDVVDRKSVV